MRAMIEISWLFCIHPRRSKNKKTHKNTIAPTTPHDYQPNLKTGDTEVLNFHPSPLYFTTCPQKLRATIYSSL